MDFSRRQNGESPAKIHGQLAGQNYRLPPFTFFLPSSSALISERSGAIAHGIDVEGSVNFIGRDDEFFSVAPSRENRHTLR
jgi:hypothetical protein